MERNAVVKREIASDRFRRGADHSVGRSRTLAGLMDTAVTLFAERGVDRTSVLDITTAAGVANGTFYNYFANKQQIVDAVYETITASLRASMDVTIEAVGDGPSQMALATMWFIEATTVDPHWGSMTINALEVGTPLHSWTSSSAIKAINNGVREGRFTVSPCETLIDYLMAVVVSAIRKRLAQSGAERERTVIMAAETQLRMLGMTSQDASNVVASCWRTSAMLPKLQPPRISLNSPRHVRVDDTAGKRQNSLTC